MNNLSKKITALFMAVIIMMSAFSSYACIAASAVSSYETASVADVFKADKAQAGQVKTPDKTEDEPLDPDETSDLNPRAEIRKFFQRIIEIIKAILSFFRMSETPEPEPEIF